MFYFKKKKAVEHLVNKKKKENTLKNELIKMKSCRTLNRQTVVDCDTPRPTTPPYLAKIKRGSRGGGLGGSGPPHCNLWSNKKKPI